jgi:hypothetical protein
MNFLCQE